MVLTSAVAAADLHSTDGGTMIDLLNDPQIRAELASGVVLGLGLAFVLAVTAMTWDLARYLTRGRNQ